MRPVTTNLDPPFLSPLPLHIFRNIWTPGPYISEIYGPPCMLSTIAEIQKGQGLGSGYEWLAGLVSRVCMVGLVFRVCMGSVYFGGPNITWHPQQLQTAATEPSPCNFFWWTYLCKWLVGPGRHRLHTYSGGSICESGLLVHDSHRLQPQSHHHTTYPGGSTDMPLTQMLPPE